jgi:transcriptional regulator with XRE-family HTH domain
VRTARWKTRLFLLAPLKLKHSGVKMKKLKYKEMGERLKEIRCGLKKTQKQLATEAGINEKSYSYYETGYYSPCQKLLVFLSKEYRVNPGFIFTGEGTPFISKEDEVIASFIRTKPDLRKALIQLILNQQTFYYFMALYTELMCDG